MRDKTTIDISTGIVFRTILILIGLWFLYFIRDIIVLVFIAILIVSAMDPIVSWLQKRKIRRSIGVILVYLAVLLVLGLSVSFVIPPLVDQFLDFAERLPDYFVQFENTFQGVNSYFETQHIAINTQNLIQEAGQGLASASRNIFSTTVGVFSGFISLIVVLMMAFYMTVKENGIKNFIVSLVPEAHKEYAASLTDRIKNKIGRWTLGQLFLMFLIFAFYYLVLTLLGVPYALALAILGGLFEVVPYLGPIMSSIPAIFAGLLVSPFTGLMVLIAYIVIQQLENHVITPQLMSKVVGLHPVAVILALLIGFDLGGVLGAILAIPMATAVSVFVGDLFAKPKES